VGAYRWERRLPRSARWVSFSTDRLMTADRFSRIAILHALKADLKVGLYEGSRQG